ncbi:MAG: hypothetical protein IKR41_03955 [Bacteroidales bacterium]|nr:hypothetical protein [Bacteroidales bacterium]
MKKKLIFVSLFMVFVFAIVSCHKNDDEKENTTEKENTGEKENVEEIVDLKKSIIGSWKLIKQVIYEDEQEETIEKEDQTLTFLEDGNVSVSVSVPRIAVLTGTYELNDNKLSFECMATYADNNSMGSIGSEFLGTISFEGNTLILTSEETDVIVDDKGTKVKYKSISYWEK